MDAQTVSLFVLVALFALGLWLGQRHSENQRSIQRAALLTRIADEAAAFVIAMNPKASFPVLMDLTVKQLTVAGGIPTRNLGALQRAAAAALARFNKLPS